MVNTPIRLSEKRAATIFVLRVSALAALLAALAAGAVPTPETYFGFRMGADRKLVTWDKVVGYFDALAAQSDRVKIQRIGNTVDGKPMIAAFIADAGTLRNLDRYREIQTRLADPRRTTPAQAQTFIADGKTIVMITCTIHSTEVASTLTAVEFAHRLITEDTPKHRAILANTILILVPSLNPDGVDIVAKWYEKTLGTKFEGTGPPELYQRYLGHDDNRDWYIFSQPETRNVISQLHNVWHPQIVYDVHQQGEKASRMFVPPWMDPIDPNVDPIIAQLANAVGSTMASDLTAAGKTGVAINALYDFWTPSRHYQAYHGGLRILSESASARLATPVTLTAADLSETALGYSPRERSWNHLEPWAGGTWRLRDIVDYQLIAFESLLYHAATRRDDFLQAFWKIGTKAVERHEPAAFLISKDQFDPGSARRMLETLQFGQVEIDTLQRPIEVSGKQYPPGSYVIRMQQPYSAWAKTLLEVQHYPDLRLYPGGPPKRPYDVTAQTLPLLMGVEVATLKEVPPVPLQPAKQFAFGSSPGDIDSWRTATQAWAKNAPAWRDTSTGQFFGNEGQGRRRIRAPRIGLYKSYMPSMDEGWTRWLLENFGFKFASVNNREIVAGDLNKKYDVIVFPDQAPATIDKGYANNAMPSEYMGGLGTEGAEALKKFAAAGGVLVMMNDSAEYAIEHLGVNVRNVVKGLATRDFYSPGSIFNATAEAGHPLTLGLPHDISIWSEQSPAFQIGENAKAIVQLPAAKSILASGWLLGSKYIENKAALVDVTTGSGHVLLFGMRPQYRAQSYQTFKLFFNSLIYAE